MHKRVEPFKPGDHFRDWVIKRLIGKGGHAYVYEAQNTFTKLDVAIKIIPSASESGRDLVDRARSEAQVLARLHHPNVVQIGHAGATEDGLVYLVMPLLRGQDLRKAINQYGRLSVAEVLIVIQQVCEGVGAAHVEGAIHRDLKPENIFMEYENRAKVLDFGVAKVMGYGAKTTERHLLHGTVLYMSPEQLKGFGVTPRSDIFALGTIAYEALYGHPAVLGADNPTVEELGWRQIEEVPKLLSELDSSIPSYVARLIDKAIMKNPEQRYQSMGEMGKVALAAFKRYFKEAEAAGKPIVCRPLWGELSVEARPAGGEESVPRSRTDDTDIITHPPFSDRPASIVAPARQGLEAPARAPATSTKPISASQLTPAPTTSGIIDERPAGVPPRPSTNRLAGLVTVAAVLVGLALGVVLMQGSKRPAEPEAASSASVVNVADARGDASKSPPPPQTLPVAAPAASSATAPPAAAGGPAILERQELSSPGRPASKPTPVARSSSTPAATPARSGQTAKPMLEMDERLLWLERDLKTKPGPYDGPKKSSNSPMPSSGLD